MTDVAKEKSEICHITFTFPITVANENFNLARALDVCSEAFCGVPKGGRTLQCILQYSKG
jgi:hypothetical protein